jgi:hypothetical protein
MEEFLSIKTFILTFILVYLTSCTYTSTEPKARGYLIAEGIADTEKVLSELESIAMKFSYKNSYSQDLPTGSNGVVLKKREYQSADLALTFFFHNYHGLRCISFGIYSDLREDLVDEELKLFKAEILKATPTLEFTTKNCGGLEKSPSIFDRNS